MNVTGGEVNVRISETINNRKICFYSVINNDFVRPRAACGFKSLGIVV